jgi:hypothetical protein
VKPPCLRCRKPLRSAPTTKARIYLCPSCVKALGGEKKAAATIRREWRNA